MCELPRGEREQLRLTFTLARMPDGREVAWHALRVWYRADSGEMRPGKQGVTLRGRELRPVLDALTLAISGGSQRTREQPDDELGF